MRTNEYRLIGAVALLGVLFWITATFIAQETTLSGDPIEAAEQAVIEYLQSVPDVAIQITPYSTTEQWVFGMALVPVSQDSDASPQSFLFLARQVDGGWEAILEHNSSFAEWVNDSPIDLLTNEQRLIYSPTPNRRELPANWALSWPTTKNTTVALTGGPHKAGWNTSQFSAFDISGGDTKIRVPVESGIAYIICAGYVRVDFDQGRSVHFYHLENVALKNNQSVARWNLVGYMGTSLCAGGSASGPHGHIWFTENGAPVELSNLNIGGWVAEAGKPEYAGCFIRQSDQQKVCPNSGTYYNTQYGALYNNGTIAESVSPTDAVVLNDRVELQAHIDLDSNHLYTFVPTASRVMIDVQTIDVDYEGFSHQMEAFVHDSSGNVVWHGYGTYSGRLIIQTNVTAGKTYTLEISVMSIAGDLTYKIERYDGSLANMFYIHPYTFHFPTIDHLQFREAQGWNTLTFAPEDRNQPAAYDVQIKRRSDGQLIATASSVDGAVYISVNIPDNGYYDVYLINKGDIEYGPGNLGVDIAQRIVAGSNAQPTPDPAPTPPQITSITANPDTGNFVAGQTISLIINFSESATLSGGNILITLSTGNTIQVLPFEDQSVVTVNFTIPTGFGQTLTTASPSPLDVISVALSPGASLTDGAGDTIEGGAFGVNLATPDGQSLADNTNITVDPAVVSAEGACPSIPDFAVALTATAAPEAPDYICVIPNQGRPTIVWRNDPRADWYQVWIGNTQETVLLDWFPKDDPTVIFGDTVATKAQCDGLICTLKPNINPLAGSYEVWMQAWGSTTDTLEDGQYSIGGPLVEAPSWNGGVANEAHAGFTYHENRPNPIKYMTATVATNGETFFAWSGSEGATWYNVWMGTAPEEWSPRVYVWALAESLGCENGGTCTLTKDTEIINWGGTPDFTLSAGDYIFYVQSWGPAGFSTGGIEGTPWVESAVFKIP